MYIFHDLPSLAAALRRSGESWTEFLRVPALSAGIYVLATGAADPQTPHTEDEVYFIVAGRGVLRVDGIEHPFAPGSVLFVPARAPHRFERLTEDLTALVVFAPAEGSAPGPPPS